MKKTKECVPFENRLYTMRDLAQFADWSMIKKAYRYYYNVSDKKAESFQVVFMQIMTYPKRKHKDPDERIEIIVGGMRDERKPYSQENEENGRDEFYATSTNKYSLSFRKWAEVSNIIIDTETLKRYTAEELLAHFLYELTWYGSEQEMEEKAQDLVSSCEEFKRDSVGGVVPYDSFERPAVEKKGKKKVKKS